ncbi:hypothetical protein [Pseudoalteromonas sp. BSi20429]|uniref:DUF6988 family protein n=1 Tax=Pseudoalteromonas sp. BSi20429 TaxID=1097676 RepID=UPI0002317D4F|nr:hypothetical protein [Pseudoalteromonas sp. BSi20429]GAA69880.1 hypothetical protein P20429_4026 [Pseudoalteromonas sp. BSi20429]
MDIDVAESWSNYYQAQLDGMSFEPNPRRRVAMGLLHLSLEHQQSILKLAQCNLFGSSLALLRCQFEALLRGVWFLRCANDADIDKFVRNKNLELKVNSLINDVEQTKGYQSGVLMRYKAGKWKSMNDYTHGGFFQIASRTQSDEISGRNLIEYSSWILTEASKLSFLAVLDICQIIDQPELSSVISATYFDMVKE